MGRREGRPCVLTVRMLGKPRLERDGVHVTGPRGHKAWALLARLVRSADPVSRQTLVDELFSQADDPMVALRWNLTELRRRLGTPEALQGDPLTADFGPDVELDVTVAARGRFAGTPPEGRFLERVDVRDSATFDTWLLVERERVDAEVISGIREATLRALSTGDAELAIDLARVMVARDPLAEGPHVLLISALRGLGTDRRCGPTGGNESRDASTRVGRHAERGATRRGAARAPLVASRRVGARPCARAAHSWT